MFKHHSTSKGNWEQMRGPARKLFLILCQSALLLAGFYLVALRSDTLRAQDTSTKNPDMTGGTIRSQHGDWQVVCKPPLAGANTEVCAIVQSVTAQDRDNVGLTVYFQKFANGVRILRVFAPLGILLPPGIGLKIDDIDVGHAPFLRCHTFACYAQVTAENTLIEQLKKGKNAIFIIFQTEEAGIGIPLSLKGFEEAFAKLPEK